MKTICKRIFLELKSLRLLLIAPLIAVHILLPLTSYLLSRRNPDEYYSYIIMLGMIIIPVSSVIWSLFILKENVEGKGNELLYIGKSRIKFWDCLIPYLIFFLTVLVQYGIYTALVPAFLMETIRISGICFMFCAMTYLLTYTAKSASLTLMVLLIYTIISFLFSTKPDNFVLYMNSEPFERKCIISNTVPQIALGAAFMAFSLRLNKRFCKFN